MSTRRSIKGGFTCYCFYDFIIYHSITIQLMVYQNLGKRNFPRDPRCDTVWVYKHEKVIILVKNFCLVVQHETL